MDVEQIQKINTLALNLMKQGLAADRREAVEQAEKIFRERDTEVYNSIKETMQKVEEQRHDIPSRRSEELPAEKVSEILEKNTLFLVKKIKEFEEKMESLQREVADVRTKLAYKNLPTVNDVVSKREESRRDSPSAENKESASPAHPRSGNYKEADVSIEKFFYMGSK